MRPWRWQPAWPKLLRCRSEPSQAASRHYVLASFPRNPTDEVHRSPPTRPPSLRKSIRFGETIRIFEQDGPPNNISISNPALPSQVWLNGTAASPLIYDFRWGGVMTCGCAYVKGEGCTNGIGPNDCPALSNPGMNFGLGFYNDHHFHFGEGCWGLVFVFVGGWERQGSLVPSAPGCRPSFRSKNNHVIDCVFALVCARVTRCVLVSRGRRGLANEISSGKSDRPTHSNK